EWRIVVDSSGAMAIEQVRFPRLTGIPQLGRGEELAVPRWMGALAHDPATLLAGPNGKGRRFEWAYPGTLSLQVMAWYRRGCAGPACGSGTAAARPAWCRRRSRCSVPSAFP